MAAFVVGKLAGLRFCPPSSRSTYILSKAFIASTLSDKSINEAE